MADEPGGMWNAVLRWALPLAALVAIGPLAGVLTGMLRGADGGPDATPLVCGAPLLGIAAAIAGVLVAIAWGVIVARILDERSGFYAGGFALAWVAWRTGELDEIIRWLDAGGLSTTGMMVRFTVEAVVLGVMVACGAALISVVGSKPERPGQSLATRYRQELADSVGAPATWGAIVIGALAALVAAFVIARSADKGQAVMAGVLAGIAASASARLAASAVGRDVPQSSAIWSVVLAAAAAPIIAVVMHGSGLETAIIAAREFAPARVLPLDWLAGAVLGVPIGARWVQSSMERRLVVE